MSDHLVRGLALGGRVRWVAADAGDTAEELRRVHDPSPTVAAALARVATGALLLASSQEKVTHREPMLTLEIDGGGPAGRVVATASPAGWVRAMVANPLANAPPLPDGGFDVPQVVGTDGHLVVTRDLGFGRPYRGVIRQRTGQIAEDLAHYLNESEQSPSAVVLAVSVIPDGRVSTAGGYLLQLLPGVSNLEADRLSDRVRSLGPLTRSLSDGNLPADWLAHLFPSGFQVLDRIPVRFLCGCSQEKVERALKLLGPTEVRDMVQSNHGRPEIITCQFCKTEYPMSRDELAALLLEIETDLGEPQ